MGTPRILITGGRGLLGLNWAATVHREFDVFLGLHKGKITPDFAHTKFLDFQNYDMLSGSIEQINPNLVVHAAGLTSVEECEADKSSAHHANVETSRMIARVCSTRNLKMVHISTDHLFDGSKSNSDETSEINPLNMYAETKAKGELAVLDENPSALVARTNFFGWGPTYRQSFSDYIIGSLKGGRAISLFTDVYFNPILAQSLVHSAHQLVEQGADGIYNVVGSERVSKWEFGRLLAETFGLDTTLIRPSKLADRVDLCTRPFDMSLDNTKMCNKLGIPGIELRQDIAKLLEIQDSPIIQKMRSL